MPLPADLQLITLTGTFRHGNGDPRTGDITLRLSAALRSQTDDVILPPFQTTIPLVGGAFAIDLPATTDPQWAPTTGQYLVQAVFTDGQRLWWSLPLPHDTPGSTIDLADVGPPNTGTPGGTPSSSFPVLGGGYRGTWDAGTLYRAGDTVQYGSANYGALRSSTGITPGTDASAWKLYPGGGGGGGAVSSVFGRTGDVAAQAGDYAITDITGLAAALAGKQPLDADLTAIAALTPTNDYVLQYKAGAWSMRSPAQVKADLALVKTDVGLGNVDNTSDAAKPLSTAATTALAAKADLVGGVVPTAQIPAIAITEYLGTVASQAAMLALAGQKGDFAIRSDTGVTWIITGTDPTQLASWTAMSYPAAPVLSVNSQTGTVVLSYTDVGAASTSDTRLSDTRTPTDGTVTTVKIVDGNVTLAKIVSIATATILGNATGGSAAPTALTASQVKTLLAITQGDVSGLTAALALLAPLASPALTGTATAVNLTLSGRQLITPDTLTDAATIAVDASLGNDFTVTLGGNRTLGNPSNPSNGQKILFAIRQDGTGSRTLTLDTAYRLGSDIASVTLSTAAGKTDYLGVRYNSTDSKWDVIAFVRGY